MSGNVAKEANPTLEMLGERLKEMENMFKANLSRAEDYTREKPMKAICMAFFGGAVLGFAIAVLANKDED